MIKIINHHPSRVAPSPSFLVVVVASQLGFGFGFGFHAMLCYGKRSSGELASYNSKMLRLNMEFVANRESSCWCLLQVAPAGQPPANTSSPKRTLNEERWPSCPPEPY